MNTTQRLLMESGTLNQIEKILKDHEKGSVAEAAKEDRKAVAEIKAALKSLRENEM